jgi:hypothetical protein
MVLYMIYAHGHGLHFCMRHHLPYHPVSQRKYFYKVYHSVKKALSVAVCADDYPQFVLKINDYRLLLFVNFFCCFAVLWIWDVYPGSGFFHPVSGFFHPESGFSISDLGHLSRIWIFPSRISDLAFFLPGFRIWIFPDSGSGIFHPGSTSATLHWQRF